MENFEGFDLFTACKRKLNYNEQDARNLIKELLKIIKQFHDEQIIVRDINPKNIMIM